MDKEKVLIVCALGMSSSLLVTKTKEVAKKRNVDITIESMREADARTQLGGQLDGFTLVLLGPQIRHLQGNMKKAAAGKNVRIELIDMATYGQLNGEAVLDQILTLI